MKIFDRNLGRGVTPLWPVNYSMEGYCRPSVSPFRSTAKGVQEKRKKRAKMLCVRYTMAEFARGWRISPEQKTFRTPLSIGKSGVFEDVDDGGIGSKEVDKPNGKQTTRLISHENLPGKLRRQNLLQVNGRDKHLTNLHFLCG